MDRLETQISPHVSVVTDEAFDDINAYETRLCVDIDEPEPHSMQTASYYTADNDEQAKRNHDKMVELTKHLADTFEQALDKYNGTVKQATDELTTLLNPTPVNKAE